MSNAFAEIDKKLMREWFQLDEAAMNSELADDAEARSLAVTYDLEVLFNSHASEPRWEVTCRGKHRCFSNEYSQSLGSAIRECVAKVRK